MCVLTRSICGFPSPSPYFSFKIYEFVCVLFCLKADEFVLCPFFFELIVLVADHCTIDMVDIASLIRHI